MRSYAAGGFFETDKERYSKEYLLFSQFCIFWQSHIIALRSAETLMLYGIIFSVSDMSPCLNYGIKINFLVCFAEYTLKWKLSEILYWKKMFPATDEGVEPMEISPVCS